MGEDRRDLLEVLRAELEFLKKDGYRHPARAAWRPQFIFQDSPTCLNFEPTRETRPCSDCILIQLVPEELRGENIPCRYIPLNERYDTIDSLYRTGTQEEIESVLGQWLKARIAQLERENAEGARASTHSKVHIRTKFAIDR